MPTRHAARRGRCRSLDPNERRFRRESKRWWGAEQRRAPLGERLHPRCRSVRHRRSMAVVFGALVRSFSSPGCQLLGRTCSPPGSEPCSAVSRSLSPERQSPFLPTCRSACQRSRGESERERRLDLEVAHVEGSLIEPLAAQSAGDFVVALAGIAGTAGWRDVVERVTPATGECRARSHAAGACPWRRSTRSHPKPP